MQVKAEIARPAEGETVPANTSVRVCGAAWACDAEITKVELSTDGGATWNDAKLLGESNSNAWRLWEFIWQTPSQPGKQTLIARATDSLNRTQPALRDPDRGTYMINHLLRSRLRGGCGDRWEHASLLNLIIRAACASYLRCHRKNWRSFSPNAAGTAESRTRRRTTVEAAGEKARIEHRRCRAHRSEGGELFIVDNSDSEWKGLKYLQDWTEIAKAFDIASGFFEIGSLLALDGRWQQLEKIRILLGAEMSARTRQALLEGLKQRTDHLDQASKPKKNRMIF